MPDDILNVLTDKEKKTLLSFPSIKKVKISIILTTLVYVLSHFWQSQDFANCNKSNLVLYTTLKCFIFLNFSWSILKLLNVWKTASTDAQLLLFFWINFSAVFEILMVCLWKMYRELKLFCFFYFLLPLEISWKY